MRSFKKLFAYSLAGASLLAATAAPAPAAHPAAVGADIVIARPIGFLATVGGAGFWAATSPFTFFNGTAKDSYEVLVEAPADYTFKRPLGDGL